MPFSLNCSGAVGVCRPVLQVYNVSNSREEVVSGTPSFIMIMIMIMIMIIVIIIISIIMIVNIMIRCYHIHHQSGVCSVALKSYCLCGGFAVLFRVE